MEKHSSWRCHSSEEKWFCSSKWKPSASPIPVLPSLYSHPEDSVSQVPFVLNRLTFCCYPALNLIASAMWKQPNLMGECVSDGPNSTSVLEDVPCQVPGCSRQETLRPSPASATCWQSNSVQHKLAFLFPIIDRFWSYFGSTGFSPSICTFWNGNVSLVPLWVHSV